MATKKKQKPKAGFSFRGAGIALVLLAVADMVFLPEHFLWFVGLIYGAIFLWGLHSFYEVSGEGKKSQIVAILPPVVVMLLFTFLFVWINAPLNIQTVNYSAQQPSGKGLGNISWRPMFNDLRIYINNPTAYDYDDLDIVVKPDEPVTDIGQVSTLPDVFFSQPEEMNPTLAEISSSGEITAIPHVFLASNAGYRVHCKKLPSKMTLEIVIAIAQVNTSLRRPDHPLPHYWRFKYPSGLIYWVARRDAFLDSTIELYGSKPTPTAVHIEGQYSVFYRKKTIQKDLKVADVMRETFRGMHK